MAGPPSNIGTLWALAQGIARSGMTFANAWESIRQSGLAPTRSTFQQVYSLASRSFQAGRELGIIDPSTTPGASAIIDSPLNYDSTFAYKVEVEGTILGTTETGSTIVTVTTDEITSLDDALTTAVADVILDPKLYGLSPTVATVLQVERSAWSWNPAVAATMGLAGRGLGEVPT